MWQVLRRRWRRSGPLLGGAVLVVAGGVAVNRVEGPLWTQIVAFAVALGLFAWAAALGRRDSNKLALRMPDEQGRPPRLDQTDVLGLGVQASTFGPSSPYVRRDQDVEDLVADPGAQLVVVTGPRLAGASRTLAHAAILLVGDRRLVYFEDLPATPLRELVGEADWLARHGPGTVVWFDRARLSVLEQITPALLAGLPDGLRIFLTIDEAFLDPAVLPADSYALLTDPGRCVRLGLISPDERARLAEMQVYAEVVEAHTDNPGLMGELMVSLDQVESALTVNNRSSLARTALLRGVTDWTRLQVPLALDRAQLLELAELYWRPLADVSDQAIVPHRELTHALDDALDQKDGGAANLIVETVLDGQIHHSPHPLLPVIADNTEQSIGWGIPEHLWDALAALLTEDARRLVGLAAFTRGDRHGALRMLSTLETTPFTSEVALAVADTAERVGEPALARRWYLGAIESGNPDYAPRAMHDLGILEAKQGNPEQARHWWRATVDSGHPDCVPSAMLNLGRIESDQNEIEQARHWYQATIDSGDPDCVPRAMLNLGVLEYHQNEIEQARHWYQATIDSGHPEQAPLAMLNLGALADEEGKPEHARHWWQATIDSGHPDQAPKAMFYLGFMEKKQGEPEKARHWYQATIDSGHPDYAPKAMHNFGVLKYQQNELDQAWHWYLATVDSGHPGCAPTAMLNLAYLEDNHGTKLQAELWARRAIATQDLESRVLAMVLLGDLVRDRDPDVALRQYHDAVEADHPGASPIAMVHLGALEADLGNTDKARAWLCAAIDTGHPEAVTRARRKLARGTDSEDEQSRAEQ